MSVVHSELLDTSPPLSETMTSPRLEAIAAMKEPITNLVSQILNDHPDADNIGFIRSLSGGQLPAVTIETVVNQVRFKQQIPTVESISIIGRDEHPEYMGRELTKHYDTLQNWREKNSTVYIIEDIIKSGKTGKEMTKELVRKGLQPEQIVFAVLHLGNNPQTNEPFPTDIAEQRRLLFGACVIYGKKSKYDPLIADSPIAGVRTRHLTARKENGNPKKLVYPKYNTTQEVFQAHIEAVQLGVSIYRNLRA